MSKLKYKDYYGSVDYEDGTLIVQILYIDDVIITECQDASKVEECFAELVDDYLDTCKEIGKEPTKPFRGTFNVRIGPELHKAAFHSSARQGERLNAWVCRAIEAQIEKEMMGKELAERWLEVNLRHDTASVIYAVRERKTPVLRPSMRDITEFWSELNTSEDQIMQ